MNLRDDRFVVRAVRSEPIGWTIWLTAPMHGGLPASSRHRSDALEMSYRNAHAEAGMLSRLLGDRWTVSIVATAEAMSHA